MRVDAFDFDLPQDLIALRPAVPRDSARLLVVRPDDGAPAFKDRRVLDLPGLLRAGDILVFNDTRVIPARLVGRRVGRGETAPRVEATLHKRETESRWLAFARPARKLAVGDRLRFGGSGNACLVGSLEASVAAKGENGEVALEFDLAGAALDEAIAVVGILPLPPYIASKRPVDQADAADYQTVYARQEGAVAAPTAGLHFSDSLLQSLDAAGIERVFVTLHVGAGTFLPVKADRTEDHRMHPEWGVIEKEVAERIGAVRARGGRVVAVGTTSLRLLESAATDEGRIAPFRGDTDIFISPGYRFRATDMLLTNFHLPRSTLFMLVAAFSGLEVMQAAYAHAIDHGYRFYSYGDACLLERSKDS